MEVIELTVERRSLLGKKSKRLLEAGYVPGVIYGHVDSAIPIQVARRDLREVIRKAGFSRLITLRIRGEDNPHLVLLKDIQRDPITLKIRHVDFYKVAAEEKITAEVPLVFRGESPAVASGIGVLLYSMETLEVECLPKDLPPEIEVDLSVLKEVDDAILVRDLKLPPGVTPVASPDEEVVRVVRAGEEEVEEEVPAPAAEVEVVAKGKAAREEEED